MSPADPVYHQIPCNTSSREVAFGIKIKCSRQFSMFSLHCKLWRITSLSDIITYSGTILDLTSVGCTLTVLYWILHLFGISRQGLNPLSQAYLAQFHFFPSCLCHYSLSQMHWPNSISVLFLYTSLVLLEKGRDTWARIHSRYFASCPRLSETPQVHWLCFHSRLLRASH